MLSLSRVLVLCRLFSIACIALLLGCGRGEYERRMNENLQKMRGGGPLSDIPNTPLKFSAAAALQGAKEFQQPPTDPGEQDPFNVPNFRSGYQGSRPSPENGLATTFMCYVCAAPNADWEGDIPAFEAAITAKVQEVLHTAGTWEDVSCPKPDGTPVNCRRFNTVALQKFPGLSGAPPTEATGAYQIYIRQLEDARVIFVLRVPEPIAKEVIDGAPAMVGSVRNPVAPAAPAEGAN